MTKKNPICLEGKEESCETLDLEPNGIIGRNAKIVKDPSFDLKATVHVIIIAVLFFPAILIVSPYRALLL